MTDDAGPAYGSPDPTSPAPRDEFHVTLLGGLRRSGRWSVPRRTTAITLIGGVDLDLREATLPPGDVVLQHFSVIGGVDVSVPPGVAVRSEGFRLLGGNKIRPSAGPATTTLVIRSFGLLGGVKARGA